VPAIPLDVEKLERVAGVKLDRNHVNELVELLTIYEQRFKEPAISKLLLKRQRDWVGFRRPRRAERDARRAFVEAVEGIWRECGGKTQGSYYDPHEETHTGPLVLLLQELFRAINTSNSPSAATLHHDITFVYTGRERDR
jgi:hypothetical protein